MGINVTHTMDSFQFENRENLRNAAKNLLLRKEHSQQSINNVLNKTIFAEENNNPQLSIIKASTQISLNESLKETLKYLNSHAAKKHEKRPVLGELWNTVANNSSDYDGELLNFEVDDSLKNIFAA